MEKSTLQIMAVPERGLLGYTFVWADENGEHRKYIEKPEILAIFGLAQQLPTQTSTS